MGLKSDSPSWGSDLHFSPIVLPSAPPRPPSSLAGPLMSRHCHQDTCSEKMPERGGTWWSGVGICLFICLPGFRHLFIPRSQLWQGNCRRGGGLGNRGNRQAQKECGLCLKITSSRAGWTRRLWQFDPSQGLGATGWGRHGVGSGVGGQGAREEVF